MTRDEFVISLSQGGEAFALQHKQPNLDRFKPGTNTRAADESKGIHRRKGRPVHSTVHSMCTKCGIHVGESY